MLSNILSNVVYNYLYLKARYSLCISQNSLWCRLEATRQTSVIWRESTFRSGKLGLLWPIKLLVFPIRTLLWLFFLSLAVILMKLEIKSWCRRLHGDKEGKWEPHHFKVLHGILHASTENTPTRNVQLLRLLPVLPRWPAARSARHNRSDNEIP